MNKGGFSWKRLLGVSSAKARISRSIGIPITKSGRQRKVGRALSRCIMFFIMMTSIVAGVDNSV
jgi:hypothetical protein